MKLRVATYNLENLEDKPGEKPKLKDRIPVLRPQLERLNADILCFQEVHGQERTDRPRDVLALKKLLQQTKYSAYRFQSTMTTDNQVYDKRNLVVVSKYNITDPQQLKNDLIDAPQYKILTDGSNQIKSMRWERPILYTKITVRRDFVIHLINLHLKS